MVSVYFFAPNLIGYARIALTIYAYVVADTQPTAMLIAYALGFVLDAVDGYVARLLGQSSNYGAILDMVTDRCATVGLLMVMSRLFPQYFWGAVFLVLLDTASHFVRIYSSAKSGQYHKDVSRTRFALLRLYYGNRQCMGLFCVGQEFFYLLLYLSYFRSQEAWIGPALWYVCFPLFLLKQLCNLLQLMDGMALLADLDTAERMAKRN
jgi:CDP-diacylglycerol--inositol 3-phosphatidyltransferase